MEKGRKLRERGFKFEDLKRIVVEVLIMQSRLEKCIIIKPIL